MNTNRSTDNFLPRTRIGTVYISRPVTYIPRRETVRPIHPSQVPISDILPRILPTTENQPVISATQAPLTRSTQTLDIAVPRTRRSSRKQLIAAWLTIVLIIGAAASLMSFRGGAQKVQYVKTAQATASAPVATQTRAAGWPVRVIIPKIAVDAPLDYIRLTSQGALDTPHEPGNAGWYDKGPRPGEKGTAVIDGHFGWKNNLPAVFDQLHTLLPGDLIQVEDERGQTISFVVRELRTYQKDRAGKEAFVTNDDAIHLNLITCEGTWNEAQKSYTNRLVVFADKQ